MLYKYSVFQNLIEGFFLSFSDMIVYERRTVYKSFKITANNLLLHNLKNYQNTRRENEKNRF